MQEIEQYLREKGIVFHESNGELVCKCLFSNCDSDSRENEAHLYFSKSTGQYHCKKCDAKGNLITLKKYLGEISVLSKKATSEAVSEKEKDKPKRNIRTITPAMVDKYHEALPSNIIKYLHSRGLTDDIINNYKLGYGNFYGRGWIIFPIKDIDGNFIFFKLRQDPKFGKNKLTWPKSTEGNKIGAQIYDWDTLFTAENNILIVEGELDMLLMKSMGIECITNTHGAGTVKEVWGVNFNPDLTYYICYDDDDAGKAGAKKMASMLLKHGCKKIFIITLPEEVGEKGDLGDYVVRLNLPIEDLFTKYAKTYPEKIDTSSCVEMSIEEVCQVLDATIKKDDENKAITFLTMLATYTEESQTNVFFSAPSSTGKSHIPLSVADLFPTEDKIILANCSPTAFFHEQGMFDKEKNEIIVDLSKKILIFTDMPDTGLIARLRSLLSHDAKESHSKITDKSEKGGNRTKNVTIIGYPTVYFCSANFKIDEQESTRFIVLSPSIEHDKLYQGIQQSIAKETDREKFTDKVNSSPERNLLKKRILGIRQENIDDIKICDPKLVEELFLKDEKSLKPRQQRDIKKIITIIKGFALLNLWFRKRDGQCIVATEGDIRNAFNLWDKISYGQDYGLSPYVFEIYMEVIIPLWNEPSETGYSQMSGTLDKKSFVTRKDILRRHFKIYKRQLSMQSLRIQILPQLEQSGLIVQERSTDDKREMVVIPIEAELEPEEINSVEGGVVNTEVVKAETAIQNKLLPES
jgi:hypothetical protein